MYFETTCKVNNNGKISGYHKRGKLNDDGTKTYFVNDKFGDAEDVRRIRQQVRKYNTNPWLPCDFSPSEFLDTSFFRPILAGTHRTIKDDNEFIDYCEKQTKEEHIKQQHKAIKSELRRNLNHQLDIQGYADPEILSEFKWVVEHEQQVEQPEDEEHWKLLSEQYLKPKTEADGDDKHTEYNRYTSSLF